MPLLAFILLLPISIENGLVSASRCPEPRKPHSTSCTTFYNCINLPDGGFVWAPAKCTDGLMYQPQLRICVLPGDSWTCDDIGPETQVVTENYKTPELIDPNQTSYLGYTENSADFEPIDSSHIIDGAFDRRPLTKDQHPSMVTPYPLLEVTESGVKTDVFQEYINRMMQNIHLPTIMKLSVENDLQKLLKNRHQVPSSSGHINAEQLRNHLSWFSRLISELMVYQGLNTSYRQTSSMTSTDSPLTEQPSVENTLKVTEYSADSTNTVLLSYLMKNYVLENHAGNINLNTNSKETESVHPIINRNETENNNGMDVDINYNRTRHEILLEKIIKGQAAENSIVSIKDNLGGTRYITITKYRTLADHLDSDDIEVLPCTNGARLPNITDCTKYYICEPKTAIVVDFSCPPNTAFNDYRRVCDVKKYENCFSNDNDNHEKGSHRTMDELNSGRSAKRSPCQTIGKHGDPTSESHYYLCYSSSGRSSEIVPIRMTCPNGLIFCHERKVCTLKQICTEESRIITPEDAQ
ncbi:uncharacterized protein LOC105698729 [Orussus abietinus]|uniref:uncharacterized protein LOC105698729 n=1 Tax=Orussus abietinus TaxID=222816 RepID=UPI0006269E6F|nr:uncharacterized protein LOC105698729 [Orussus abietinus]